MKKALLVLGLSVVFFCVSSGQARAAQEWTGNINFTLGAKALDDDDWEPVEDQGEFGINVDFRQKDWPVNIAVALIGAGAEDTYEGMDVESVTSELRFGVKKIWAPNETMRPFLGGGLALVTGDLELGYLGDKISDDDSGLGVWLEGGVYWTIGGAFNLGFEIGYSTAEVTLFGVDVDAGGGHAGLLLGYHW